jgi:hypothetical protein
MTDAEVLAYVRAAAAALALPLDEQRVLRVAVHLMRTAKMARDLERLSLDADVEPAALYCPAPFPPQDDAQRHHDHT